MTKMKTMTAIGIAALALSVLIPVPVLTPRLSGLWLGLVTPAQARIGRARQPTVPRWAASLMLLAAMTLPRAAGSVQTTTPVRAVPFVDLARYAGDWL